MKFKIPIDKPSENYISPKIKFVLDDEYNKVIAYFNLKLFTNEPDKLMDINNAHCIFLAKSEDEARYRAVYEMMMSCLLEGMPIYSIEFVSVSVCPVELKLDHGFNLDSETEDSEKEDDII